MPSGIPKYLPCTRGQKKGRLRALLNELPGNAAERFLQPILDVRRKRLTRDLLQAFCPPVSRRLERRLDGYTHLAVFIDRECRLDAQ